ncbi:MAG: histidinol dehydrogenase [Planctomycetota bacterium]
MKIVPARNYSPPPVSSRPEEAVKRIIAAVRRQGLTALKKYSRQFDGGNPRSFVVPLGEARQCWKALSPQDRQALSLAKCQLEAWGRKVKPRASTHLLLNGLRLSECLDPVDSAAVYVPGGRFPLVSSTLMGLVPARVAGVRRRVLLTPAKGGTIHPAVLAAAHLGGATEIWAVGGAHGIAAAALGAGPLRRVDLIVGPGNSFVTEAKRQLQGEVGIDMLAGPSELLVVVDESTPLEPIALDLLAQAEHGPDSHALALSTSKSILSRLQETLARGVAPVGVQGGAERLREHVLDNRRQDPEARIVGLLASSQAELIATSERLASEHLMLATKNPRVLAKKLRTYGTLFLGSQTPVALGDYVSGANHILPTGGSARWRGGLSPADFLARRMVQEVSTRESGKLFRAGARIAALENLTMHEASLRARSS